MSDRAADEFKAFEAEGWSARARTYGDLSGAVTSRFAEPLLDAAGVRGGDRVLDVATGPGYVAERAAARGAKPLGVDIAEGMLAVARERLPGLEFRSADAEDLPFEDGSFEVVVGNFVINHLPRPERAAAATTRVLEPRGGAAFSVWAGSMGMPVMGLVGKAVEAAGIEEDEGQAGIPSGPDPWRFAEEAEFRSLLAAAGLVEVAVEQVELVHRVSGPEELWRGFLGGSVRGGTFVRAQPQAVQARIREALHAVMQPYLAGEGFELPVVAKIGSGRKA
jgi:SAM-dependent methyltransferase